MKSIPLLLASLLLAAGTGCSSSAPQPTGPTDGGEIRSVELLLSRGALGSTTFEQYKFERGQLYYECGSIARGRYAAQEQELVSLGAEALTSIQTKVSEFTPLFHGTVPQLDPAGKSSGMFDPGQASLTLSDGATSRELRTSLDAIVNGQGSYPTRMQQLAVLFRRAAAKAPCGNDTFFGLAR